MDDDVLIPSEDAEEDEENVLEKIRAEAQTTLSSVTKGDITEIKSLANPPKIVQNLMYCVAIVLGKRYFVKLKPNKYTGIDQEKLDR